MAYRINTNKAGGLTTILFTSNTTMTIVGNTAGGSNVASEGETVTGATITQVWAGSPSGNAAYWTLKRGANTIFVIDSTCYLDFRGNGVGITLDPGATLEANLNGSTAGTLLVEIRKSSDIKPGSY